MKSLRIIPLIIMLSLNIIELQAVDSCSVFLGCYQCVGNILACEQCQPKYRRISPSNWDGSSINCVRCPSGFSSSTGTVTLGHVIQTCNIACDDKCTVCSAANVCQRCAQNYFLTSPTCTPCSSGMTIEDNNQLYCLSSPCSSACFSVGSCYDTITQCTQCKPGFSFGTALSGTVGISSCTTACDPGLGSTGSTAALPSCTCNAPCVTCAATSPVVCLTCPVNHRLASTACIPCGARFQSAGGSSASCTASGCLVNEIWNEVSRNCAACSAGLESAGGFQTSCICSTLSLNTPTHPCFPRAAAPCTKLELRGTVLTCTACIEGYTLNSVTSLCQFPVTTFCGPRNYFQFNFCLPVNALCGEFDLYTGACKTCADAVNFSLVSGLCIRRVGSCTNLQVLINNTCVDRQPECQTIDSAGKCILCFNATLFTLENGTCRRIVLNCSARQYQVGLECVNFPEGCFNFVVATGICMNCFRGYTNDRGVCREFTCPDRFFADLRAQRCSAVNIDCLAYDPTNGDCQSCVDPSLLPSEGRCVRGNTLAGCKFRQLQGFGPCEVIPDCRIYNLIAGTCIQCDIGFNVQNGNCVPRPICNTQEAFGSICRARPANCTRVDALFLCTQCTSADFEIINGLCVLLTRCTDGQYLNSLGNCIDANPGCGQVNPSNGQCVTCRQTGTSPSQGFCCPRGQIYNVGGCAVVNPLINPSDDGCQRRNPSTRYCLKCASGLRIDPIANERCIPL